MSDVAFEFLFAGPVLPSDSDIYSVPLVRSREKQLLVASILDSFSNLLPSATYLRSNINTGMGFLLGDFYLQISKYTVLHQAADIAASVV